MEKIKSSISIKFELSVEEERKVYDHLMSLPKTRRDLYVIECVKNCFLSSGKDIIVNKYNDKLIDIISNLSRNSSVNFKAYTPMNSDGKFYSENSFVDDVNKKTFINDAELSMDDIDVNSNELKREDDDLDPDELLKRMYEKSKV